MRGSEHFIVMMRDSFRRWSSAGVRRVETDGDETGMVWPLCAPVLLLPSFRVQLKHGSYAPHAGVSFDEVDMMTGVCHSTHDDGGGTSMLTALAGWAVLAATAILPMTAAHAASPGAPIVMVPHRAVYDMVLGEARSGSSVTDVQGRMVFEITGSACEGYTQNMRFVTRMSGAEGQPSVSDLRSTTFETGDAQTFRFSGTQARDQKPGEASAGEGRRASRDADLAVELMKPEKKKLSFGNQVYLPVQHSIALVAAGRSGQTRFKADLFDGSETGEKVYETTATIGGQVAPGGNKKLPVLKNTEVLDALPAWPVSISYYEKGSDKQDAAPAYELSFLFFENGVTRKLVIDYGEFSIKGDLKEILFLDPTPAGASCVAK